MDVIRSEIAALAAQLIADGGMDYQSAKRKAARDVLGDGRIGASSLPDNDLVDRFLLEHLQLFDPEHEDRLAHYRAVALEWMARLEAFNPYLTGAAWKGIVARHAPVHLQLFTDEQKELEIFLIDHRVDYETSEHPHFAGGKDVPAFHFESREVPMLLTLFAYDDLRGALRRRAPSRDLAAGGLGAFAAIGGAPGGGGVVDGNGAAAPRADRGNRDAVAALVR